MPELAHIEHSYDGAGSMKILAVNSARAIWLVKTLFLNPRGRSLVPAIVGLADRYKFTKLPSATNLAAQPLDLKFENGTFAGTDGTAIAVNFSVLDDGVIAETRASTRESEHFIDEVLTWASSEFGLPLHSELRIEKIYASELIVELELSSHKLFSQKFAHVVDRFQRGVSNNPGVSMQLVGLHFGPDPGATKKVAPFKIERLANVSFERNEYYTFAPVPTAEHVDLLEAIERFGG